MNVYISKTFIHYLSIHHYFHSFIKVSHTHTHTHTKKKSTSILSSLTSSSSLTILPPKGHYGFVFLINPLRILPPTPASLRHINQKGIAVRISCLAFMSTVRLESKGAEGKEEGREGGRKGGCQ